MNKLTRSLVVVLLISLIFITGCSKIDEVTDKCKLTFEDCNYNCGEGILNSICKEKCTYQYNKCVEEKNGQQQN